MMKWDWEKPSKERNNILIGIGLVVSAGIAPVVLLVASYIFWGE